MYEQNKKINHGTIIDLSNCHCDLERQNCMRTNAMKKLFLKTGLTGCSKQNFFFAALILNLAWGPRVAKPDRLPWLKRGLIKEKQPVPPTLQLDPIDDPIPSLHDLHTRADMLYLLQYIVDDHPDGRKEGRRRRRGGNSLALGHSTHKKIEPAFFFFLLLRPIPKSCSASGNSNKRTKGEGPLSEGRATPLPPRPTV